MTHRKGTRMSWHATTNLLRRYGVGDPTLAADAVWAVEVHLESCADCRAALAAAVGPDPLIDEVWAGLDLTPAPAPVPRRGQWLRTWATPAMAPWLATSVLVLLLAFLADRFGPSNISLALLIAPVTPVAGVAAAWARGIDPAHEVVAATPRAGLYLVLRRTAVVVAVLIPLLALATWASPARWLLPSLAFAVGTLALGGFIGVRRAAVVLMGCWTGLVIAPTVLTARPPVVFEPAALGFWLAVFLLCAAVVRMRATVYLRLDH